MRTLFNSNQIIIITVIVAMFMFSGIFASDDGLNLGDQVPAFSANNQDGELWRSADFLDKKYVVVYFYPAALTSGCTKQACSYRDNQSKLQEIDAEVVGISADPVKSLKIFGNIYRLNFTLLSDTNGDIAKMFGVPVSEGASITREIDGKEIEFQKSQSIKRWTFIMDKSGKIVYKDTDVSAQEDSDKVIKFLEKKLNK
jgi:thioredoxin-dependent peroxiredoxin